MIEHILKGKIIFLYFFNSVITSMSIKKTRQLMSRVFLNFHIFYKNIIIKYLLGSTFFYLKSRGIFGFLILIFFLQLSYRVKGVLVLL